MNRRATLLAALAATLAAGQARAQDLFRFDLNAEDGSALTVGGSSLPGLLEDMVNMSGDFSPFSGVGFDATLRYAGVDDAMRFSVTQTGDEVGLQFSLLGLDSEVFTFTGPDADDQLVDFLKKRGSELVTEFQKQIARRSVVAVTDGNPSATTARASRYRFHRFGIHADLTPRRYTLRREVREPEPTAEGTGTNGNGDEPALTFREDRIDTGSAVIRIDTLAGTVDTDAGDGSTFTAALSIEQRLGERFSLVVGLPFHYHDIQGADVFNFGVHLDAPVRLVIPESRQGWAWTITPGGLLAAGGSYDFMSGGLMWGAGLTSVAGYTWGDWTFSMANQFDAYESIRAGYAGFEFDPGVSQQLVTNGLKTTWAPGESGFLAYGGLSATHFLKEAAVDDYYSPMVGVGLRGERGFGVSVGYEMDVGTGYESHRGRLAFQVSF